MMQGGKSVLVLDDREDVTASTASLLEAHDMVPVVVHDIDSAWAKLKEHPRVRVALVDNQLDQRASGGLDFLIEARQAYRDIDFYLITAWDMSGREQEKIKRENVQVLHKGYLRGSRLVEMINGSSKAVQDDLVRVFDDGESSDTRLASLNDSLMEVRFEREVLLLENVRLKMVVKPIAEELVYQLRKDLQVEAGVVVDEEWSVEELVDDIMNVTPEGGELISAYVRSNRCLVDAARRRGRWLGPLRGLMVWIWTR